MRARIFFVLTVAALASCCLSDSARATMITYDGFNDTIVDPIKWTVNTSGGSITEGGGVLTVAGTSGYPDVLSISTFAVGYVYEFKIGTSDFSGRSGFGLKGAGGAMYLRNDYPTSGIWQLATYDGTTWNSSAALATPAIGDVYDFVWTADKVELYQNSTLVATNTTNLPSGALQFHMFTYPVSSGTYDYVAYEQIPEPSAAVLMAAGLFGLLCYAWKKRK